MRLKNLKVGDPFNSLFPIDPAVLDRIQQDMQEKGYDVSQPIIVWAEKSLIVDGHTRYQAAKNLKIDDVPVIEKEFRGEDEALKYAIHNQRNRRNLTDEVLLTCIEVVDRRLNRGGDRRSENAKSKAPSGAVEKSADYTAKVVGVSPRKVERARTVLTDPQATAEVKEGKKAIYRASQETVARRKHQSQPAPTFGDEDKRQAIILRALAELRTWRQKYGEYSELSAIFEAIDRYQNGLKDKALPEIKGEPNTDKPQEDTIAVTGANEADGDPHPIFTGDEISGRCTAEDLADEPGLSDSEKGEPENEYQTAMDPDESGTKENYHYCRDCQEVIPDPNKAGEPGSCKFYSKCSGVNPNLCSHFRANESSELKDSLPMPTAEMATGQVSNSVDRVPGNQPVDTLMHI